jgi:hypothetical protein
LVEFFRDRVQVAPTNTLSARVVGLFYKYARHIPPYFAFYGRGLWAHMPGLHMKDLMQENRGALAGTKARVKPDRAGGVHVFTHAGDLTAFAYCYAFAGAKC